MGYRPGEASYSRLVTGLVAAGLASFVLLYYVQPLLPALAAHFAVSPAASAEVLSVATLAMAAALLVAGPLSDAIGRVVLMRWSLVAAGALGLASAFAPTWASLLILRGLTGVALAGVTSVAMAYLLEEVDPSAHLRATAAYITGTAAGGALGRLLPGPLEQVLGWTGTTIAISAVTLAAAAVFWIFVPASRGFRPRRFVAGTFLRSTRATVLDPILLALFVVGSAGMGAFVAVYNAIGFRLAGPPFGLGQHAVYVYLAYPAGLAAPWLAKRFTARVGRSTALLMGLGLLALALGVIAVPLAVVVMAGLGLLTFAFLGSHSLASGAVATRARSLGVGVAQASSCYLATYYVGSAAFGALSTRTWSAGGWPAVTALSGALAVTAVIAAVVVLRGARSATAAAAAGTTGAEPIRPPLPTAQTSLAAVTTGVVRQPGPRGVAA